MPIPNKAVKRFMQVESSQIPLIQVDYDDVKDNCMDPVTKKPYKGIILYGVFADLSGQHANNNNRFYDVPTYLEMLGELRKKVFDGKGVYGELEHPKSYAVNYNNVSHKILDVWYVPETQQVMGYVLLLNTETGKKAQEIVRSGGCLAISARAAGEELTQSDGTKACKVKLLTTYDLVYHPGFSEAVLNFKELNESQKFIENDRIQRSYSMILFDKDVKNLDESYNSFIKSGENDKCFFTWLNESIKSEEDIQNENNQESDEKKMQDNSPEDENELQDNLKDAVQKDLSESEKHKYIKKLRIGQKHIRKRHNELNNALYDNSTGFLTNGISK